MKKTKLRKKAKEKTGPWYRSKCVTLAKAIARKLADYKCEYCGAGEPNNQTHGSHVHCEHSHHSLSADLQNIICLCSGHHVGMGNVTPNWHKDPRLMMKWFEDKFPERVVYLNQKLKKPIPMGIKEWKELHEELKTQWNNIING